MTDLALTHDQALGMLRQKRLHAIERRAMADDEIRIVEAQIAGFEAAIEMIPPATTASETDGADKP